MRRAARKDANHNEICKVFRDLGWSVLETYQLKECCDCFVAKHNRTIAVEIKDGSKPPSHRKLTKGEQIFKETWKGEYAIVECVNDVLAING